MSSCVVALSGETTGTPKQCVNHINCMWCADTQRCVAPWEPLAAAALQKRTLSMTSFYNAHFLTLTGCLCVSLRTSCAHSSTDPKNRLLTCHSPFGRPHLPRDPVQTIKKKYKIVIIFNDNNVWFLFRNSALKFSFNHQNWPPVYTLAVVSVALKGETWEAFSFSSSWTDLGLGGAPTGTLLGGGAGKRFFPFWRGQEWHDAKGGKKGGKN